MDKKSEADLRTYLRQLRWGLAPQATCDRDDILEETRLHILARIEQGQTLQAVLSSLGPAEIYASRFNDEMEITGALGSEKPVAVLFAILRRAHRSLTAVAAVASVFALSVCALAFIVTAGLKPFDPEHIGLWLSAHGGLSIGSINNPTDHRELLGGWIYPVAAIVVSVAWLLGRLVLIWALRRIARRSHL